LHPAAENATTVTKKKGQMKIKLKKNKIKRFENVNLKLNKLCPLAL